MKNNFNEKRQNNVLPRVGEKTMSNNSTQNQPMSKLDDFKKALYEMFWKTPYEKLETIVEVILLLAGGLRTIDFMQTMGQSALMSIFGLAYAELLILVWEALGYRGKSVKVDTRFFWEKIPIKRFPFFNQKSIARAGLVLHLLMAMIFTTSDVILTNLKAITGSTNIEQSFGWILGFGIGIAFALDLVFLLIYKNTDPEFKHKSQMEQLSYEIIAANFELEKVEKIQEIEYRKKNATPLAQTRAKLGMQRDLLQEFGETLGEDFVTSQLEHVDLSVNERPEKPRENLHPAPVPNKSGKDERQDRFLKEREMRMGMNRKPEIPVSLSNENKSEKTPLEKKENFPIPRQQNPPFPKK